MNPLPKSSIEITIVLTPEEFQPFLVRAAESLSRDHKVPGFRPGKVPLALAIQRFGEQAVRDEATESAIRDSYVRAVRAHDIKAIGSPKIELGPSGLTPGTSFTFTATVAVLPEVTLPDVAAISVAKRSIAVPPADVDRVLEDLRKMRPKEALTDRSAAATDKVVVDLDLTKDNVPLDGGQAHGHHIHLSESYYLPKVKEELIGMAAGATKTFPIVFPDDHYQKHLAGTTVDATVTVKDVYTVELPTLDDAFAKAIGQADLATLRQRITENLTAEATKKAQDAEEVDMLERAIAAATFTELPELLITGEARSMIAELERGVQRQGLTFEDYLENIKKTRDEVFLEFAPDAVKRVKIALLTRAVAVVQTIVPSEADVEAEIARQLQQYANEPAFHDRIQSEEARDYVRTTLRNRAVIAWLRGQVRWTEPTA